MFEQVSNVLLTEEVPTDDGGEGEEEHADCDEDCAEVAIYALERSLSQLSSGQRLVVFMQLAGAQYGESSQVQNDQSIDEYRADRNQTLVARMVNLCYRMRMWGRTHTSFVGEQAAGNAVLDCGGYRNAGEAAQSSARIERADKDLTERFREVADVHDDQNQSAQDVEDCHDWNQFLSYGRDTADAAQEDKASQNCYDDTNDHWINAEGAVERSTDRVGLYHVAEKAECQRNQDRKDNRKYFAERTFVSSADVVSRSAGYLAVFINGLVFLCQRRLNEDGGHTEDGGYPHPEDSARAAHYHRGGSTGQVTGTYLRGNRGGQCLEGGHTVLACLCTVQVDAAEYRFQRFAKLAELNAAESDGKPDTGTNQEHNQNLTGHYAL